MGFQMGVWWFHVLLGTGWRLVVKDTAHKHLNKSPMTPDNIRLNIFLHTYSQNPVGFFLWNRKTSLKSNKKNINVVISLKIAPHLHQVWLNRLPPYTLLLCQPPPSWITASHTVFLFFLTSVSPVSFWTELKFGIEWWGWIVIFLFSFSHNRWYIYHAKCKTIIMKCESWRRGAPTCCCVIWCLTNSGCMRLLKSN